MRQVADVPLSLTFLSDIKQCHTSSNGTEVSACSAVMQVRASKLDEHRLCLVYACMDWLVNTNTRYELFSGRF